MFDYVIVAQQHYWSLLCAHGNANSLIVVRTRSQPSDISVGELLDIIALQQTALGVQSLGCIRWLKRANTCLANTFWSTRYRYH